MKKLVLVMILISSVSAMATEFKIKLDNLHCTIKNNQSTRTEYFGKNGEFSATETKSVSFDGLDVLIEKAAETSTDAPAESVYTFHMIRDGKSYLLRANDSRETAILMKMVGRTCR